MASLFTIFLKTGGRDCIGSWGGGLGGSVTLPLPLASDISTPATVPDSEGLDDVPSVFSDLGSVLSSNSLSTVVEEDIFSANSCKLIPI
jgi:hypothetical protein